jgi:hypothetical protein
MSRTTGIISDKRKASARKHAKRVHVCGRCGKECRGNGGWSSHRKACAQAALNIGDYIGSRAPEAA